MISSSANSRVSFVYYRGSIENFLRHFFQRALEAAVRLFYLGPRTIQKHRRSKRIHRSYLSAEEMHGQITHEVQARLSADGCGDVASAH